MFEQDQNVRNATPLSTKVSKARKDKKDQLTRPFVVSILLTAGIRLPLWMMVFMVAAVPLLPRQVHAYVHRVRPVTWKQMKGMVSSYGVSAELLVDTCGFSVTRPCDKVAHARGGQFFRRAEIRSATFDRARIPSQNAHARRSDGSLRGGEDLYLLVSRPRWPHRDLGEGCAGFKRDDHCRLACTWVSMEYGKCVNRCADAFSDGGSWCLRGVWIEVWYLHFYLMYGCGFCEWARR